MNVHALKNYIKVNEELIELVLEKAGFHDISDNFSGGIEYRCAREEGKNPTAVRVNKETLKATCFSTNLNGDLITLIQDKTKLSFTKTIEFISKIVSFEEVEEDEYQLPFGGFYKKIQRFRENNGMKLEVYDESILDPYARTPIKMFYEDGISFETQDKYKIGYDVMTDRITCAWRTTSGELCGVMGRLNKREVNEFENKWFPIIPFPKSKTIFGFSENYRSIQNKGICHVFESEKSPMILDSMGSPLGLGLGGSNLSDYQANNIKSLFTEKIIVGMDEGLAREVSVSISEKLKMNRYFKNEVLYIYDKNNLWLPKGSKMSPVDLPKEDYKRLLKHCLIKI